MSDKLKRQIDVELAQLRQLLEVHRPLLEKCETAPPTDIELSALGAMLHAFYTGVENILKRIVTELDGGPPQGDFWHRELLQWVSVARGARPPVISADLLAKLHDYLSFRHVFRQAYSFQLRWDKMSQLVLQCEAVFERLRAELAVFSATA